MKSPLFDFVNPSASGALSHDTKTTPRTMTVSVRHLRPLMVVPSMSTAKNAVARTFSCDIAVKTAASMRSSAVHKT